MPPKKKTRAKAMAKPKMTVPRNIRSALDAQAVAWARILNDPCSAPLAHPCYAGADGGILVRCESSLDIGTTATITSGAFFWTPGGLGSVSVNATGIAQGVAIDSNTNLTQVNVPTSGQPGYTYLSQNSTNFRAVAACMQITYLGSEANRSGMVNYGVVNGSTYNSGDITTSDALTTVLERFERTPVNTIEMKWRPSAFDQTFKDTTATLSAAELSKYGALGLTYSGLQAAAGLRVRMVAIYEFQPNKAIGIVSTSASRNTSTNSLDHVINFLDSSGAWMYNAASAANRFVRGASAAVPYVQAVAYGGTRVAGLLL